MKNRYPILGIVGLIFFTSINVTVAQETTCSSCEDCNAKLDGSYDVVKLAADIINHLGDCIEFHADNTEFDCQGNMITGNTSGQQYYGILAQGKEDIAIRNCVIGGYAINGSAVYLNATHNSTIDNNTVLAGGAGITLENSTHNDITNNRINNTNWALALWQFSHFNRIINNTVLSTEGIDVTGYGNMCFAIEIIGSNNNLIDNNYVSDTTAGNFSVGMYMESAHDNTITNNRIYNTIASGTDNPGFGIYAYSFSNNTLINNTINLNGRGTTLLFSSGNTLTNNEMSNNAFYGIALHSFSNNNTLTGNSMNNNGWVGIWVYNSSNSDITNNILVSNNDAGIYLSYSNNNTLNSNQVCHNTESDFRLEGGSGNFGDENTCDTPDGWNDMGTTGCTYRCSEVCDLAGDYPPCGEVTLPEVIDFINQWAAGNAELSEVIDLINTWASG